jgi:predicted Zn-dependent protease
MLQPIQDALRRTDYDTAVRLAREALSSLPSSPDLLHLLALGLFHKGQHAEGEDVLAQAIALAPHRGAFLVTRGELAFARGNRESARQDLKAAIEQDPNLLAGYVGLARIEMMAGDFEAAEGRIKYGRRIDAEHPGLLRVEAELGMARGDLDAALSALDRAVKQQPNNPELHFDLAVVFQRRGLPAVAAQALRNTLRLAPGLRVAERMLVTVLLDANETKEAQDLLLQILRKEPEDAGGWGLLGQIAHSLGNLPGAEQATLQSLVIAPEQPALIARLLELWSRADALPRARAAFDALLEKHPQSTPLWNARFSLDVATSEGETVLARWRSAQPESLDVLEADAQRASTLGEHERAEAIAREVLEHDPQRVAASMVLARSERERDPETALVRLAALAQRPLNLGLLRSIASLRGLLLDRLDRRDQALEAWMEVHVVEPGQPLPGPPLPAVLPEGPELAADAPRGADARLLWPLPGTPVGAVLNSLGALAPFLVDRFNSTQRIDGLGPLRPQAGHHGEQGADAAWREQMLKLGLTPEQAVDVLPHADRAILSALPDARLLVLLADPRELLLNWIAFGSLQGYAVQNPTLMAGWLAESLSMLVERLAAAPDRTRLLRVEALRADPQQALREAAEFLGLQGEPGDYAAARGVGQGEIFELAPERWRMYAPGVMAEAFERLAPIAEALGYPR